MDVITLDYETFYSVDYSLSKMSEVEYILDPRFELILCGIKWNEAPAVVARGDADIRECLASVDWNNVAMLSHNARFDAAILSWKLGITPRFYLDTLSMARGTTHAYIGSSSLDNVAKYFELAPKGGQVYKYKGRWFASFTKDELDDYASYCAHDTELCKTIFNRIMAQGFPKRELRLIDLNLRKFLEPQARLNPLKLAEHLTAVRAEKEQAMIQAALMSEHRAGGRPLKDALASNQQFAELLRAHGVHVPMKISPTTGKLAPALARNDPDFRALCEDLSQPTSVQALLAARLGVKSTIEETRAETLLNLSRVHWGHANARQCWMPVPYSYYGAHTGRFSGAGGMNFTNLKRGSVLRDSIEVPDGEWRIVHRDSSQIEARILAWLAGCDPLSKGFAEGRDVYSEFASVFYDRRITKANIEERFVGKTVILSLGYSSGWKKLKTTLYLGNGGVPVVVSDAEAERLVRLYRDTFSEIPGLWRIAGEALRRMAGLPTRANLPDLPVVAYAYDGRCMINLPNGMALRYPNLRQNTDAETGQIELVYDFPPHGWKRIYGAKLIENITQALARIVITDVELRVWRETGYRPFLSTYDSHDWIVAASEVHAFDKIITTQFAAAPTWAPGLVLSSEGGWGKTLLQAEHHINE